VIRAVRVADGAITVDGHLTEASWHLASPAGGFRQREPEDGAPAQDATEVRVLYDDAVLYVGIVARTRPGGRVVARVLQRDRLLAADFFGRPQFGPDDAVAVVLDAFHDHRNAAIFATNPNGAEFDALLTDEGREFNVDWRAVWSVRAAPLDGGWSAEFAIPFRTLRYPAGTGEQTWGFNVARVVRSHNEESLWTAWSRDNEGLHRISRAGHLAGLSALPRSGLALEGKPYLLAEGEDETGIRDARLKAGGDVKYEVRPGLTLDATVNTDFAQVEVDSEQVNLTRFDLFFPEKRDFFLEGQGIFAFGGVEQQSGGGSARRGNDNTDLTPIAFFSRRIGLTESGVDPIRVGGRLTGRAGRYRVGALNIQTGGIDETGLPASNFSVFRLRRDVLRRSDIGVIATHRTTSLTEGADSNSLLGIDGNFAFFENLRVNAYYAVSRTPLADGGQIGDDESSYTAKLDYSADRYGLVLEHLTVGEDFKPELGFLSREAFRRNFAQARFSPRPQSIEAIRRMVFESELDYITDLLGRVETKRLQGTLRLELENGDDTRFEYTRSFEFLPEEFEISDGIVLPVAEYRFQDVRFEYQLGPQRTVPGTVSFRAGSFFSGDRKEASYDARVEISPKLSLEPRFSINWVDLPEGGFTASLVSTRLNVTFTPRTFVSSFIQYNSSSHSLSASVRFRWEYEPGSDLFVVYSEGREDLSTSPFLASRTLALKFTKLFRF
jgi:hypothetical protein